MLIYVTGRPVETVEQFCRYGYLPLPHFVIGDHGTHIVDENFSIVTAIQNPIIKKWNHGNALLKNLLANDVGIELQPIDPPYRITAIETLQNVYLSTYPGLQSRGLERKDLEPYIGTRARIAEILGYKRDLTLNMIRKLHDNLHIPTDLLIKKSKTHRINTKQSLTMLKHKRLR